MGGSGRSAGRSAVGGEREVGGGGQGAVGGGQGAKGQSKITDISNILSSNPSLKVHCVHATITSNLCEQFQCNFDFCVRNYFLLGRSLTSKTPFASSPTPSWPQPLLILWSSPFVPKWASGHKEHFYTHVVHLQDCVMFACNLVSWLRLVEF